MKYRNPLMLLTTVLLLGFGSVTNATTDDEAASKVDQAALQAQLEADYKKALSTSKKHQLAAETSIEKARTHLRLMTKERRQAIEESHKEDAVARAVHEAKRAEMNTELNHARRQLRETSREIARVNRQVAQARAGSARSGFVFSTSDRPVIGVILGQSDDVGVKVLGVSPDGPSERAGIKQGDVIIAMGGRVLAAVDEDGNTKSGLETALKEIKSGEAVIVSVERGEDTLDLTVVPEIREPLTWQSVTRFRTAAPLSPGKVTKIERIVVPEIDTVALAEKIEQMQIKINARSMLIDSDSVAFEDAELDFEFHEFHELSEIGDFALHDVDVWFGLPLTQGLKLAEVDTGLGEYFKTDRGVLVLKAKADNELQLESGDVILQVGNTDVNSPADFMRALRDFHSGDEFEIDIKRKRKDHVLKTMMPDSQSRYFSPEDSKTHTIQVTTHSN